MFRGSGGLKAWGLSKVGTMGPQYGPLPLFIGIRSMGPYYLWCKGHMIEDPNQGPTRGTLELGVCGCSGREGGFRALWAVA